MPLPRALLPLPTLLLPACGTIHVTPPASPADPVPVHIADYGDTARLLLPDPDAPDYYTEFAYGDYRWYALDNTNLCYGSIVLLIPTKGALARRQHAATLSPSPHLPTADEILTLEVNAARAKDLHTHLSAHFDDHPGEIIHNDLRALEFAPAPRHYWLFNQSSTTLARWLRDLGCQTQGWTLIADFKLCNVE